MYDMVLINTLLYITSGPMNVHTVQYVLLDSISI